MHVSSAASIIADYFNLPISMIPKTLKYKYRYSLAYKMHYIFTGHTVYINLEGETLQVCLYYIYLLILYELLIEYFLTIIILKIKSKYPNNTILILY